jgi:glucose-1-phosphate cytidylyltransferase
MTGGRIRRAAKYLDGDTFLMTYGDGVSNVKIDELIAFHRSHGKLATITSVRPLSRFGVLDLGADDRVTDFREKPLAEGWINAGYGIFNRKILDLIDGDGCIFEQAPLQRLAREGQLMTFKHHGFFFAMDTYREYTQLNAIWNSGNAPWKVWQ